MAVKAKDQVTIVDMTDVKAVTIYYLLQASALAAPSAPTIKEPTNWSTTEPAFDNTTTKTLYTCVRTLYKNGTFNWGDVSVSSSYEAAKVAYNKAAAALPSASFTQNQIFNKLTNNGALQGWFFGKKDASGNVVKVDPADIDETCDLYVNASYVNAGLLKSLNYVAESAGMTINLADGTIDSKNFKVDASGNLTIKNGGITIKNNDGTTVMAADTNGDLSLTSKIYATGGEFNGQVRVRSGTNYGSIIIDGTRVNNAFTYNGTAYDRQAFVEYTGAEMIFKIASTAHDGSTTPITSTAEEFGRIVTNINENWAGPRTSSGTIRNAIEILMKNYGRFLVSDDTGGKMLEVNNEFVWAKNFVNGSSERLKKNIEPAGLKAAYDALKSSKIYQYNYKTEDDAATVHRGFIVERECPEMFTSEDGQGVDLYSIVSTTWQLLQDMSARIDALEEKLNKGGQNEE